MAAEPESSGLVDEAAEAIRALVRAERTIRTYPIDNALSQKVLADLEPALGRVLPLQLEVKPDQLLLENAPLLDPQRDQGGLSAKLYRDGVRRIQLLAGLDRAELERFLVAVSTPIHPDDVTEDYVTRLWDAELAHVRIAAVDPYVDLDVPDEVLEGKVTPTGEVEEVGSLDEMDQPDVPPPPEEAFRVVPQDRERVALEVGHAHGNPPWGNFIAALFEVLEGAESATRISEVVRVLEAAYQRLLAEGRLDVAVELVKRLRGRVPPAASGPVAELFDRLLDVERLALLQHTLETKEKALDHAPALLVCFGSRMAATVCRLLPMARDERLRRIYLDVLVHNGKASVDPVLKRFLSAPTEVRAQLAWVLGELRDERAVRALMEAVKTDDSALKREAIRALAVIQAGPALDTILELSLTDPDPSVRMISLTGLGHVRRKVDAQRILARIQSSEFKPLSDAEKDLLYNALGAAGGDDIVRPLARGLQSRWLRNTSARDMRRVATALARIGTPEAVAVLEKHETHRKPELAAACRAALRLVRREG
jgi:HEAT repeat protein